MKTYFNFKKTFFVGLFLCSLGIAISLLPVKTQEIVDSIVESKNIENIYNYIEPTELNANTLVIFDIDNTLIYPETHLGSDQWFYFTVANNEAKGMTRQEAINATMPQLLQVMAYIWMKPVEPTTVKVVDDLQKKGVTVIALTARSLDLTYRTIEQLEHVGIHFIGKGPLKCPIQYGIGKPALYIHGIIFCGNYDKGEVLAYWLDKISYHPKKVIFIDDKLENIKSVERALHRRNYPFIGIRYGYLDGHIKTMSQTIIDQEFKNFMQEHPEARPIFDMPASS